MKKILWGGLVGAVVLFTWSFVSHMFLPLGHIGIQQVPNEDPILDAMRANIQQPGLYFLPGLARSQYNDEAAMKGWTEKAGRGFAIVIYQLHGGGMMPQQLITEFASNFLLALLAALLLSHIGGGFLTRTLAVGIMGLIAGLDVYVSYWNWFKFPTDYTLAVMFDQLIGFLLMGAALAWIVKKSEA